MYFPESLGTKSFSFRYQSELLKYRSVGLKLVCSFSPSFSQVYLRGGAPFALHFNLVLCDSGQALNALFNIFGLEKVGAAPKREEYQTRVRAGSY